MILNAVVRGEGPPLVLLHGLFGRAANFGAVQARLAAGRRVIALDLRGHGSSGHARPLDYPDMANDVAETLRAHDCWPCTLLGHSMGGKVAMTLALMRPDAVLRLIVADIAPVPYPPHFRDFAAAMLALDLDGLTRAGAEAALAPTIPSERVRRFLLQNLRTGAQPGWTCDLAGIAADLPLIESWPGLGGTFAGPCLFIAGERSDYVTDAARPAIRALFPRARVATLRDSGHWLHAENPDGFVALVDGFVARPISGR